MLHKTCACAQPKNCSKQIAIHVFIPPHLTRSGIEWKQSERMERVRDRERQREQGQSEYKKSV